MNRYKRFVVVVLMAVVAIIGDCLAAEEEALKDDYYMDDFHEFIFGEDVETAVDIPAIPKDSAFVLMPLDHAPIGLDVYVDVAGVRIDPKNSSLHFWMLLKSAQGGYNLSYESYRCSAHRYKVHGWGTRGREPEFRPNPGVRWLKVIRSPGAEFRRELDDFYFCENGIPLPPKAILNNATNQSITDDEADI